MRGPQSTPRLVAMLVWRLRRCGLRPGGHRCRSLGVALIAKRLPVHATLFSMAVAAAEGLFLGPDAVINAHVPGCFDPAKLRVLDAVGRFRGGLDRPIYIARPEELLHLNGKNPILVFQVGQLSAMQFKGENVRSGILA